MTLFCPVTGFKVSSEPEWINQKVSDSFTANFWVLNGSIVYSLPKGYADIEGVQNSLALNDKVIRCLSGDNGEYVQIEDYHFLDGSSSTARRYFTNKIDNQSRLSSIIFCNLSQPLSIAVKIGNRFSTKGKYIHVARHYNEAIKLALKVNRQRVPDSDIAPIELHRCFNQEYRYMRPVEVLCEDDWNIQTPEYSNRALVIERCILHSTSEGNLKSEHIPLIEHMREQCQSAVQGDSNLSYLIVDSSKVKDGSRTARREYMQSLKNWHQKSPIRLYIMYGASSLLKTATHLARPLMPFKVKIAKDIEHAFHLVRKDRGEKITLNSMMPDSTNQAAVNKADIDRLMAFIGSLDWEMEGVDKNFDINEAHPFYYLYQSIKLIKEEIDDLFKERKRLEDQLFQSQKMESIGTLAGGIAHDFNNMLNIIVGYTELAVKDIPEGNPAHTKLREIKNASMRAADVVRQLLDFSRKSSWELQPLAVMPIITGALKFIRSTIPTTIEIRKHIPDTDVTILADPVQINQALMNICANASQAMEAAGGTLEITVEIVSLPHDSTDDYPELSSGEYVRITASDTGPGIPPDIIDRIFDPYFTTKQAGQGSGMGLAVVHGIVNTHGGAITVDSQAGKGATFTMLFPVFAGKSVAVAEPSEELPQGSGTILFIDDERSIVIIARQILEQLGYRVETRQNPASALEVFQSNPMKFDLVITDMTMPQMNGVMLTEKLREIRPEIPVIICTGYSSLIDEDKAKDLGINALVLKPIVASVLANTIRKVLDQANA